MDILTGILLGDGGIHRHTKTGKCRLEIERSKKDLDYMVWLKKELEDKGYRVSSGERKRTRKWRGKTFEHESVRLYTEYHEDFEGLRSLWYPENKKVCPPVIAASFNAQTMAVWYMDDGSYDMNRSTIQLRTDGFNLDSVKSLCELLKRYDVEPKIAKTGSGKGKSYYIYLPLDSTRTFLEIVEPHMLPCMQRKMPEGWRQAFKKPAGFHERVQEKWDNDKRKTWVIEKMNNFYRDIGEPDAFPVTLFNNTPKQVSHKLIIKLFGSWEQALKEAGLPSYKV